MTCKPLLIGGVEVPAHLIAGVTLAYARQLAEAVGGLVIWDPRERQTVIRPALAPDWQTLPVLARGAERWPATYLPSQERLDHLWGACLRAWPRVDPLLAVAVLGQEGTGSFDTSAANRAADGGHGPEAVWALDVARAVGHLAAKLSAYRTAVAAGFTEEAQTLGLMGSAIQFCNWPGPLPGFDPAWGVYAQHSEWWVNVTAFYEEMGGDSRLLDAYAMSLPLLPLQLRCRAVTDDASLCSDETGRNPRPGVVTEQIGG